MMDRKAEMRGDGEVRCEGKGEEMERIGVKIDGKGQRRGSGDERKGNGETKLGKLRRELEKEVH